MMVWKEMWESMKTEARIGLLVGLIVIGVFAIGAAVWSFSKSYEVLFSDMLDQDAAGVIAELERIGVDYKMIAETNQILVPEDKVHQARMQLMESGIPFQGGIGFEIFDNSDFGMTEFAQKINFQRALQGELTRTISSLTEVKFARVHLVMQESSLFKQKQEAPRASITLFMSKGKKLNDAQIMGIQRLVAGSVPGLTSDNVTVVDESGLTLTKIILSGDDTQTLNLRLQKKQEVESYLTDKVVNVLQQAFNGKSIVVSVDVTLNLDRVKSTREDVIAKNDGDVAITRRKESKTNAGSNAAQNGMSSTTEVEYQHGRRIDQIVEMPGTIEKLSVGVLIPSGLIKGDLVKIRELVQAAVGFNTTRGDVIAIHNLATPDSTNNPSTLVDVSPDTEPKSSELAKSKSPDPALNLLLKQDVSVYILIALLVITILLLLWFLLREQKRNSSRGVKLEQHEREKLLDQFNKWLEHTNKPHQSEMKS